MFASINKAFKNLFKKPQTIDYPLTPIKKNKKHRGLIKYSEPHCIYCLKCEKACPPGAILFISVEDPPKNEKNKKGLKYHYNPHLCIYCTECVRACPVAEEALWQSNIKPQVAVKEEMVNSNWFALEEIKRKM